MILAIFDHDMCKYSGLYSMGFRYGLEELSRFSAVAFWELAADMYYTPPHGHGTGNGRLIIQGLKCRSFLDSIL